MDLPAIVVNFKTYEQAVGANALALAKVHEKVAKETGKNIAVCVNAHDLKEVAANVDIPVFAQHIDPVAYGALTGHIAPEIAKQAGAYGTLLNHAERKLTDEVLEKSIKRAHEAGLFVICCAETPERGVTVAGFGADLIAVEPPELIGGDISVSKASPDVITRSVDFLGKGKVLVGAGVKTSEDVKIAIELGASGVLLASGITKADDPYKVLLDLTSGL
ncbi:triose-phosphate isomerase [Candidatus Peregrinibacteria bacterium]|nr:triose-phosphate isomerase [Candidatus Peregrinibacteria bacterium]